MSPLRIYADTSVVGGCFDEEFAAESLRFFGLVRSGRIRLLISDLVIAELEDAPEPVRQFLTLISEDAVEDVPLSQEITALRDAYIAAGVVGRRWLDDAGHVAAATIAKADAIVSWNFKYIVRLDKMRAYNEINQSLGYGTLTIITPLEVPDENSETDQQDI